MSQNMAMRQGYLMTKQTGPVIKSLRT